MRWLLPYSPILLIGQEGSVSSLVPLKRCQNNSLLWWKVLFLPLALFGIALFAILLLWIVQVAFISWAQQKFVPLWHCRILWSGLRFLTAFGTSFLFQQSSSSFPCASMLLHPVPSVKGKSKEVKLSATSVNVFWPPPVSWTSAVPSISLAQGCLIS